jgi:TolA-binding protein
MAPDDWQVRYRRAYLLFARGDYDRAAAGFSAIVTSTARLPGCLKAAAMLNLAWTQDIVGRRQEALKLYKRVVDEHEQEAAAGSARLGIIAPYRGPVKMS